MSDQALIRTGQIVHDDRDEVIESLQEQLTAARRELTAARRETAQVQRDAARALGALRQQLQPLYTALQMVFGQLDTAGIADDEPGGPVPNGRTSAVWEAWKARMPGGPAKIIDALLLHKEMNTQQLAIAIGTHRNSIPNMILKLNKAGLLNKNSGKFSLKPLS
jgi:hypothetical protein